MKKTNTKQKIIDTALRLFSERGYDAVSVGEIAQAVDIKASSLYNHFESKQSIFEAIVGVTYSQYERDTDEINIHVQNSEMDAPFFRGVSEDELFQKVKQIFDYSLHNENISRFRKMMTIEQFRSEELGALYTARFVERLVNYHANIFKDLIRFGVIFNGDPKALALMYVSPVITLIGICDRQPQREGECIDSLKAHVSLFYKMVHDMKKA